MKEFATQYVFLKEPKNENNVLVITGHHDDEKMLNLETKFRNAGVGVTRIVLTNSDARDLPIYAQEELPAIRWQEGIQSGLTTGVNEVSRIDIPDGQLERYVDHAIEFGREFTKGKIAIFAPNEHDLHPDHRAAYDVALKLGGSSIAVYGMDTLDGFSYNGNILSPDFYIPLTLSEARNEKRCYRANTSQVVDIPYDQRRSMFDALGMTRRRGSEVGISHAAVIFQANNTTRDPLRELIEVYQKN